MTLTEKQRTIEITKAVERLFALGVAAAQCTSGNKAAQDKIRFQIVEIGQRLIQLEGISLVDSVYSRLETRELGGMSLENYIARFKKAPPRPVLREVTLAWNASLEGWSM